MTQVAEAVGAWWAPYVQDGAPGVVVGVRRRGERLLTACMGLAAIETDAPLTPRTRLRLASITKQFACHMALRLARDGRWSLSDSVGRHVPALPAWLGDIPLARLMDHTGGVPCVTDLMYLIGSKGPVEAIGARQQLEWLIGLGRLTFPPGEGFAYSNGGYLLLGLALDAACGERATDALRSRLFQPLGMSGAVFAPDPEDVFADTALRYERREGRFIQAGFGVALEMSGGALGSLEDMLCWTGGLLRGVRGGDPAWTGMLATRYGGGYAAGLIVDDHGPSRAIRHPGNIPGARAAMWVLPDEEVEVVVLANRDDVDPDAGVLAALLALGLDFRTPTAAPPPGTFESEDGETLVVVAADAAGGTLDRNGRAVVLRTDGDAFTDTAFGMLRLQFRSGDEAILRAGGGATRLRRAAPATTPGLEREGHFHCPALEAYAHLARDGETLRLRLSAWWGRHDFALDRLTERHWRATSLNRSALHYPFSAVLRSERPEIGDFTLSTSRLQDLEFRRV